jgi:hypothetical protein
MIRKGTDKKHSTWQERNKGEKKGKAYTTFACRCKNIQLAQQKSKKVKPAHVRPMTPCPRSPGARTSSE